jgi:hypothetical protein
MEIDLEARVLMNLNRDLLIGIEWQSTHERQFGIQIWELLIFCLKIPMETKFEFLLFCLEFDLP